jgi:hypothetical protein
VRVRYRIDGLLREVTVVPNGDPGAAVGATGFIPSPFTEPQLRAGVAAVLQRRPVLT